MTAKAVYVRLPPDRSKGPAGAGLYSCTPYEREASGSKLLYPRREAVGVGRKKPPCRLARQEGKFKETV
jgi:hypothetical protein